MRFGSKIVSSLEIAVSRRFFRLRDVGVDLIHDLFLIVRQSTVQTVHGFLRCVEQLGRGLLLVR